MTEITSSGKRGEDVLANMIEVTLPKRDNFLIIMETLSRMGIAVEEIKTLWQSCHIFHKSGRYYIVHFKEMLAMDGLRVFMTDEDIARRNTIANYLHDWELCDLVDEKKSAHPVLPETDDMLYIIPYAEKKNWKLQTKYTIGVKKGNKKNEGRK